jgi:hypothetical protein
LDDNYSSTNLLNPWTAAGEMVKPKVIPSTNIEDKFLNEPIEGKSIRIDRRNAWVEYPAQSFLTTSFPALK